MLLIEASESPLVKRLLAVEFAASLPQAQLSGVSLEVRPPSL
jgi:hypothetical protein